MMDKTLVIIMIFTVFISFASADYLNTVTTNQCVYNVQPNVNAKGLCYTKRSNNITYCSTTLKYSNLINGYEYINGGCFLKNDLKLTGLTQSEWDYLLAVLAHVMGLTMLILINFLSISIVKSRT